MCHFLKPTQELGQKVVTALKFCIAVAIMMYTKELFKNRRWKRQRRRRTPCAADFFGAVFHGSSDRATDFSQFLIVHHRSICYAKSQF